MKIIDNDLKTARNLRRKWPDVADDINSNFDEIIGGAASLQHGVVIFGDSITFQNAYSPSADEFRWSNRGFFTLANFKMGWPFAMLNNAGVSGNRTDQMLARVNDDVTAYSPEVCIVFGGVNDFINSVTPDITFANLTAIYEQLKAVGIQVVACTIPIAQGMAQENDPQQLNALIRRYCSDNGIQLVDFASVYSDVDNNSYPYQLAGVTGDGVHPSRYGAQLMAIPLIDALTPYARYKNSWLTRNAFDGNIIDNPLNTGTGGAIESGVAPDNWSFFNGGGNADTEFTGSVENKGSYYNYVVTMTNSGSNSDSAAIYKGTGSAVEVGETYRFSIEFGYSNCVDITNSVMALRMRNGSTIVETISVLGRDQVDTSPTYDVAGVFESEDIVIPAGVDNVVVQFDVEAVEFTLTVGRQQMIKVS